MKRQTIGAVRLLTTGLLGAAILLNAACADSSESGETEVASAEQTERAAPMSKEERLAMRQKLMDERKFERAPVADKKPAAGGVIGEVPDELLDKIYADLEQQNTASRSGFNLVIAESVQWPDGSLGCPEPGQMYTQAIVDGYRIVIEHAGENYDYHASTTGYFKLCSGVSLNREDKPTM